jgi:hypothetical protein
LSGMYDEVRDGVAPAYNQGLQHSVRGVVTCSDLPAVTAAQHYSHSWCRQLLPRWGPWVWLCVTTRTHHCCNHGRLLRGVRQFG